MPYTTSTSTTTFETEFAEAPKRLDLSLSLPLAPEVTPLAIAVTQPQPQSNHRWSLRALFSQEVRQRLRKMAPWLVSGSILGLDLIIHAPTFVLGGAIAALTVRILKAIIRSNPLCQRVWQSLLNKAGLKDQQIPWLSLAFGGGAWLSAALPSHALFFQAAEQYVQKIFQVQGAEGANVTTFLPLIFGTLRIIFIIYIGIALVRVINAFRNDEDWTTAARIPLIVVLCIVIGDALSSLIVQGG